MARGPFDYGVEIQDPMTSFSTMLRAGTEMQALRFRQEQAAAAAEQQRRLQEALAKAKQSGRFEDYFEAMSMMPAEQAKVMQENLKTLDSTKQQGVVDRTTKVFSALRANQPDVAIGLIQEQIQAARNSGDEQGAKFLETWAEIARVDPGSAELFFGNQLATLPGGKERMDAIAKLGEENRAIADLPRLKAQRAAELRRATSDAEVAEINARYAEKLKKAELEGKTGGGYEIIQPAEARSMGLPPGPAYQREKSTGKITALGSGGTTIKMPPMIGNIPPDYQVQYDSENRPISMTPIPGSKTARELEAQAKRETSQAQASGQAASVVVDELNRLENRIKNETAWDPVTGITGKAAEKIPGSARMSAMALIDTIRANIGFDRLNQMRQESPTGGALGNVTEQELKYLQSVLGSLDLNQKPEDLLKNVARIRTIYEGIMRKAAAYPNAAKYGFAPATSAPTPPSGGAPGAPVAPGGGAPAAGAGGSSGFRVIEVIPGGR